MESIASAQPKSAFVDYQQLIAAGVPFEDFEFPADLTSVFDPDDRSEAANVDFYASIEWKRASEIFFETGFVIFPDKIDADDIV